MSNDTLNTDRAPLKELEDTPMPLTRNRRDWLLYAVAGVIALALIAIAFVSVQGAREADARAQVLEGAQKAKETGFVVLKARDGKTLEVPVNLTPESATFWVLWTTGTAEQKGLLRQFSWASTLEKELAENVAKMKDAKKKVETASATQNTPKPSPASQKPPQSQPEAKK
jgi:hypothetical protein